MKRERTGSLDRLTSAPRAESAAMKRGHTGSLGRSCRTPDLPDGAFIDPIPHRDRSHSFLVSRIISRQKEGCDSVRIIREKTVTNFRFA